ncbi:hypothetical protein [Ramlibacter sp. Leaf400]|uniref:hypothetical protein n=1 Tax=Ramlibacter sp. Leaf400 TaxID=1736365 RepID=UPI0006FEA095|nr:hypothetical protein [Ramlibacter sp. Leaf400]KQT10674.1 hypothetical protein ASG30_07625 [Ramlibacter sp. Leaf400]
MSSSTSIGRGPAHGSNENHDGDPTHTTLGEGASQEEAPAGSEALDKAAPEVRPTVERSPRELEAARGHLPQDK